ncbi:GNAT family N-acetyltransferase [Streptomyces sp. NPDC056352]|uniref:GNAT family N-acetyltransferase n=1 Tax=Streptomyces sp. NPDC056352 TaxID=3345791 RepID=UPI0035E284FF
MRDHLVLEALVDQWRGKGIARALVAEAEKAAGSHPAGKLGAALLYVTHEPELTDFYAGLGFTLSPDGIGIPTRRDSSAKARSAASASP